MQKLKLPQTVKYISSILSRGFVFMHNAKETDQPTSIGLEDFDDIGLCEWQIEQNTFSCSGLLKDLPFETFKALCKKFSNNEEHLLHLDNGTCLKLRFKRIEHNGHLLAVRALATDHTDTVQLQKQRQDMEDLARSLAQQSHAAEASSRSKARFLAEMSHDLRTPLNAIIGFAETMEHELFGSLGCKKYLDYTRDIRASGRQLLNYIGIILEAAEREGEQGLPMNAPVPLVRIVERALENARNTNNNRIKIQACLGKDITIFADGCALTDMLIHMLKHCALVGGSTPTLRLKVHQCGEKIGFTVQVKQPLELDLQDEHFHGAKGLAEWQGGLFSTRHIAGSYFVRAQITSQNGLHFNRDAKEEITHDLLQIFKARTAQKARALSSQEKIA